MFAIFEYMCTVLNTRLRYIFVPKVYIFVPSEYTFLFPKYTFLFPPRIGHCTGSSIISEVKRPNSL